MKHVAILLVVTVFLAGSACAAPILFIDTFGDGADLQVVVSAASPGATGTPSTKTGTSMIGGQRTLTLLSVVGDGFNFASALVGGASLSHGNNPTVTSDLEVLYGGASNLLDADFTISTDIDISLAEVDQSTNISLELTSGMTAGNPASGASHSVTQNAASPGMFLYGLSQYSSNGVDLSDVDRVKLLLNTTQIAVDTRITRITVGIIPEPATMTLLGLGALALVRRRRRKKS